MDEVLQPVVSRQVLDPEALTAAIRDADFVPCQLSVRPSPSMLARVICPGVCLDFASLGPAMLFSGSMPRDCYTLVFVTECAKKGRSFNFSIEHNDGYMGFFTPGGMLDAYTPEGYANASLTVPTAVFLAAVERSFPEIPESILKYGAGLRVGESEQSHLRAMLTPVMAGIQDRDALFFEEAARKHLEVMLLDAFLSALRSGCGVVINRPGRRRAGRWRRLHQARDYVRGHLHEPIYIEDLCGELALSRRGLEMLFHDLLGISPAAFLRHQRLHGVRRALQAAPFTPGAVKKSALDWGFWHMGHFGHEYHELFGENPSTTLSHFH
jgi:AraC family transcriptional regulator, ethanolamine operon transcriptional activator